MISILIKHIPLLKEKLALDLSVYDPSFFERTIASRMTSTFSETLDSYLFKLYETPTEQFHLINLLNNSYSEFFRNSLTFAYLEQVIFPLLSEKKRANGEKEIRIWSAACAAGQEAYSIAILFDELKETRKEHLVCRIFATDISDEIIAEAKKGIYKASSLSKVTLNRIQTYFRPEGEYYRISSRIKDYINFSKFDLISDRGFCPSASIYGNFDVLFCCNLLFYYKPNIRKQILEKIGHCLSPNGFLVSGETEREILKENGFREVFTNSAIFQKR